MINSLRHKTTARLLDWQCKSIFMLCCSINKILVQQVFFRCFFTLHSLICGMESREWNESENPDDYVTVQPLDRFCLFFAYYVFMHPSPTVFLAFLGRSQPAVQQLKNSSKRSHLAVTHFSHCCNFHLCPKLVFVSVNSSGIRKVHHLFI